MVKRLSAKPEEEMTTKYALIGVGIILLFLILAFFIGRATAPIANSTRTNRMASEEKGPSITKEEKDSEKTTNLNIPSDWKHYTAKDPQFHFQTTLAVPPTYSFQFTGSEFTLQDSANPSEVWNYSTSIFNGKDGIKNYYSGESRRVWYQDYLNREFFPAQNYLNKPDQILSVEEQPLGKTSYLKASVMTPSGVQTHFLYVQNNIVHIFSSNSERTQNSEASNYLSTVLPQVLSSLSSQSI